MYPNPPVGSPRELKVRVGERIVVEIRRHPQVRPVEHVEELGTDFDERVPTGQEAAADAEVLGDLMLATGSRRRTRGTPPNCPGAGSAQAAG
jgi:hypothetical protein